MVYILVGDLVDSLLNVFTTEFGRKITKNFNYDLTDSWSFPEKIE